MTAMTSPTKTKPAVAAAGFKDVGDHSSQHFTVEFGGMPPLFKRAEKA
jgi:hypothetical protein